MCCTLRMLSHYYLLHNDSTGKEEANAVRFTECLIIFYSVHNGSQQELLEDDLIELTLLKIILKTVKRMCQRLVQVERGLLQWPKVRTQAVGMGKRSQTSSIWNPFFLLLRLMQGFKCHFIRKVHPDHPIKQLNQHSLLPLCYAYLLLFFFTMSIFPVYLFIFGLLWWLRW